MESKSTSSARRYARFRVLTLALALVLGGAIASSFVPMMIGADSISPVAAQDAATPVATAPQTPNTCFTDSDGVQAEPWMQSDLYFGTTKEDGTAYTEEEWMTFLANEVTPRFPDGLTVLTGIGQWRDSDTSEVLQERSNVLIIVYPLEFAAESSVLLEEIRDAYEEQFNQSSVLRVDSGTPVCVSF
jgi:hypothetical protein